METLETGFEGLTLIRPLVFTDERGWFSELYKEANYNELIGDSTFVQDNISCSKKNVLRGLHFQAPPFAQAKLVTVLSGKVLDVVVDCRKSSNTYGKYFSVVLDSEKKEQLYIPRGFAHGFISLENDTHFLYKCDGQYNKESEMTLLWDDPDLAIDWGADNPLISSKDLVGVNWKEFNSPFE